VREPVEQLFGRKSRVAYRAIKLVLGGVMKRAYRVNIEGVENLPAYGRGIVAANHISFLDSLFIPLAVPRRVTYLAKAEYWDSWKTRWFFDTLGQIPVRRQSAAKAREALDEGLRVLSHDGLLGIYPEGTRSPDGRLYRGKTGVARMAAEASAPIIPVGLIGTREVMPKEAKVPHARGDVTVRFGAPLLITREEVADDPLACRSIVDRLMYEIRELSGQEYVDSYAAKKERPQEPVHAPVTAA
jgi:1-acyl-sn-glycerol-3-phosphate acyltransferase